MAVTKQKFVHPKRGLTVASGAVVFILLSVPTLAEKPRQCYWCGPLAEQVHRSQRAPSCDRPKDQVTTCEAGYNHCAIVATSPPYIESRYCVKLYQDECYSLYCNTTKIWKMTCPCQGELCNGANTERETEAFNVLSKLVAKTQNNRIKRSSNLVRNDNEINSSDNDVGNITDTIEEKLEAVSTIDNNIIETLSTMSVDSTPVVPTNLKTNNETDNQNDTVEEAINANESDGKEIMQSDQPTAEDVNKTNEQIMTTVASSTTISEQGIDTNNNIESLNDIKVDQKNAPTETTKTISIEKKPATEPPMKTTDSKIEKSKITITPSEALPTAKALQHENSVTKMEKEIGTTPASTLITSTHGIMTGVTSKPTKVGENGAFRISSQVPLVFICIFHNFL